jgi:hypothetical protein
LGGDGSGGNNFVVTIVIASLRSLISIALKKGKRE